MDLIIIEIDGDVIHVELDSIRMKLDKIIVNIALRIISVLIMLENQSFVKKDPARITEKELNALEMMSKNPERD
jgi:hypothetical protein